MYRKTFYLERKIQVSNKWQSDKIHTNTCKHRTVNNTQPHNNKTDMIITIILEILSTKIGKIFNQKNEQNRILKFVITSKLQCTGKQSKDIKNVKNPADKAHQIFRC